MGRSGIRLVSFDLDGTLLDTSKGIWHTMEKTASIMGFSRELTREEKFRFVGPPLKEGFRIVYGLEGEKRNDAVDLYRKIYKEEGIFMYSFYPRLEETLHALKDEGYMLTVSTLKDERAARSLISSLPFASLFDLVHGSDQGISMGKKEILECSIRELGVLPSETVLVGDSESDEKGAYSAGARFVAVSWGFGFPSGPPEPCAHVPQDLLPIIDNI